MAELTGGATEIRETHRIYPQAAAAILRARKPRDGLTRRLNIIGVPLDSL